MRNPVIATIAAAAIFFAAPVSAAEKSNRNENIGVGSGAVIGAIAGGPVGFFVGAMVGAKIGNTMDNKNHEITGLEYDVRVADAEVARLESNLNQLSAKVEQLQDLSRPELIELMQAGIEMDLLFRTDESVVADTTAIRLAQLAGTVARMNDVNIQLDGFADQRGNADYNQALSERRVQFIRDQFLAAGVHPDRINTAAHGEAVAQDETLDSFALERRVSVRLFIDNTPSLAANPN